MRMPKSVQQQADLANRYFERSENPEAAAPAPESESKTPDAPDTATQPAQPEATPSDDKGAQPVAEEPKRSESYWEHRFEVINGKYAKEVPALRDEIRSLTKQLETARTEIADLKAAATQPSNPGGLTDEQIQKGKEEYGEEFVLFVQKMIDSKAVPATDANKLKELESKVNQFDERDRQRTQASFWTVLTELVPDWKTVNANPEFIAFLSENDPQTGDERQKALSEAQQALDPDGVAAIFNAFKKKQPKPEPQIPDDQVDPQTSRSTTAPEARKIWTRAKIKQFYTDKANGKFDAEKGAELEADIFAAQREGRIR